MTGAAWCPERQAHHAWTSTTSPFVRSGTARSPNLGILVDTATPRPAAAKACAASGFGELRISSPLCDTRFRPRTSSCRVRLAPSRAMTVSLESSVISIESWHARRCPLGICANRGIVPSILEIYRDGAGANAMAISAPSSRGVKRAVVGTGVTSIMGSLARNSVAIKGDTRSSTIVGGACTTTRSVRPSANRLAILSTDSA